MPLVAWLLSLVGPFAIRAIVALGFTSVTFAGVTALSDTLITSAQSSWSGLPLVVLQLSSLSGIPEALGLIIAAYTARLAVWAAANGTKYILKG